MLFDPIPGRQCAYQNRVVEIDGPISSSKVAARDAATGEMLEISIGDLRPLPNRAEETKHDSRFVPRTVWNKVVKLAQSLAPLTANDSAMSVRAVEHLAKAHGVSPRTVRRCLRRYQRNHRASDLVPNRGGRPEGIRLCDPQVEVIISECIQEHYLRREAPTISHLIEQIDTRCRAKKLAPPARSTVTRRVDAISEYERERRRHGRRAAKQSYEPRPGSLPVKRPLEIVQIDHTRVDAILVTDDANREPLGRPWLTVAIDVCTRCILGLHVAFDAPSATAVALCLEQVVLPKDTWLQKMGIDAPWPMFGKPVALLLDNGPEFHGEALRRGCEEYGITLQYRPVKQPHFGAHIERLVGTLMQRVHILPGTTFSNPKSRGDYDSAARAIMTLNEFRIWLIDQVTRWYHMRGHDGLGGMAPIQAWEAGWTTEGKKSIPLVVASSIELRAAFLPLAWRAVQRTGIELLGGLRYWHPALEPLIGAEDKLCVRYDPRDIRQVLARGPDGFLLEIPAVSPPNVPAISLWEHRWHRKQRRQLANDPALLAEFDQGIVRHNAAIEEASKRTRAARRKKAIVEQRRADGIPDMSPEPPPAAAPEPPFDGPRVKPKVEVWRSDAQGGQA